MTYQRPKLVTPHKGAPRPRLKQQPKRTIRYEYDPPITFGWCVRTTGYLSAAAAATLVVIAAIVFVLESSRESHLVALSLQPSDQHPTLQAPEIPGGHRLNGAPRWKTVSPVVIVPAKRTAELRQKQWREADQKLTEAYGRGWTELQDHLKELDDFVEQRRPRCRPLASSLTGYVGTARRGVGLVDSDSWHDYVSRRFDEEVLSQKQASEKLQEIVSSYQRRLQKLDNELLTELSADLGDVVPENAVIRVKAPRPLKATMPQLDRVTKAALAYEAAKTVVSWKLSEKIVDQWHDPNEEYGMGRFFEELIVGIGVDYAIDKGVEATTGYSTEEEVRKALEAALEEWKESTIKRKDAGLKETLFQMELEWYFQRREALEKMILEDRE